MRGSVTCNLKRLLTLTGVCVGLICALPQMARCDVTYYVKANGSGDRSGRNVFNAFASIQDAVEAVYACGEESVCNIIVTKGTYDSFVVSDWDHGVWWGPVFRITARDGAAETMISGGGAYGYCVISCCEGPVEATGYSEPAADRTRVTVEGFTICDAGSGVCGITAKSCVFTRLHGVAASDSSLIGCEVWNCAFGSAGLVCSCDLDRCTLAANAATGAGAYCLCGAGTSVRNSIVWGNVRDDGGEANYRPGEASFSNCCTVPMPEVEGCIADDPRLVAPEYGDIRLRTGSPCAGKGMGVYDGALVEGFVVKMKVVGYGRVGRDFQIVQPGATARLDFFGDGRTMTSLTLNGVSVPPTAGGYDWTNIQSDGEAVATFANATFYVSTNGNDWNRGTSSGLAKATIASALGVARAGERIVVFEGEYGPVSVDSAEKVIVESYSGSKRTVIDGNGSRCCTLPGSVTMVGFTLRNGQADVGGGAYGGVYSNCVFTGNSAHQAGAAYGAELWNCEVFGNSATFLCGALQECQSHNCIITNNVLNASGGKGYCGGVYAGSCWNCLIADNIVENCSDLPAVGAMGSYLYNCTATANRYRNVSGTIMASGCQGCRLYNTIVCGNGEGDDVLQSYYQYSAEHCILEGDPGFVDSAHHDWRLRNGSPCINAGDNGLSSGDLDLDGNPRIQRGRVDIGCYEYQPTNEHQTITAPVPVEFAWIEEKCPEVLAACGGDYDKAVLMKSANPVDISLPEPLCTYYSIWESYVADLDPTNSNQTFQATIEMVDGEPVVKGDPESPNRKYTVLGKENLSDEKWQENLPGARFFKVKVGLK